MIKKLKVKKVRQKYLTLNDLAKYNQEVLFPALDEKFAKIDGKFLKVNQQFAKIDDQFEKVHEEIREKFDKVLDGQDKILKILEDSKAEKIAGTDLYEKQGEKLENHEVRIVVVEQKVGIKAVK